MDYLIIAFRSRTHTMRFAETLRQRGIPLEIINTPREAYVGCGLSVKTPKKYFPFVKRLVFSSQYSSFAGFFCYERVGSRLVLKSI